MTRPYLRQAYAYVGFVFLGGSAKKSRIYMREAFGQETKTRKHDLSIFEVITHRRIDDNKFKEFPIGPGWLGIDFWVDIASSVNGNAETCKLHNKRLPPCPVTHLSSSFFQTRALKYSRPQDTHPSRLLQTPHTDDMAGREFPPIIPVADRCVTRWPRTSTHRVKMHIKLTSPTQALLSPVPLGCSSLPLSSSNSSSSSPAV